MMLYYYLIFISIIFFSCKNPLSFPCNTKHYGSDCYIAPPEINNIYSYDVNRIRIVASENNEVENIILYREGPGDTERTTKIDTIPPTNDFIRDGDILYYDDYDDIKTNETYKYSARYSNSDGESDLDTLPPVEVNHDFIGPDSETIQVSINQIDDAPDNIVVQWEANNQFEVERELMFDMKKKIFEGDDLVDTIEYEDIDYDIIDGIYSYQEEFSSSSEDGQSLGISYQYIITEVIIIESVKFESEESESDKISIDVPPISSAGWTPISSKSIFIYWDFCGSSFIDNSEYSLVVTNSKYLEVNNLSEEEDIYGDGDILDGGGTVGEENCRGYLIDNLDEYAPNIAANENVVYTLRWYLSNSSTYGEEKIYTATFPVYNMIYIPSMTSLPSEIEEACGDETESGFYIDIYEVPSFLIDNETDYVQDGVPLENSNPATMSSAHAQDWCALDRTRNIEVNDSLIIELEFKLPSQLQWMIAAGSNYTFEDHYDDQTEEFNFFDDNGNLYVPSTGVFSYTPTQSGGILTCDYANILDCYEFNSIAIGSYNGNDAGSNLATSPLGLYDCSGNLMEWVRYSNDSGEESTNKLMGGNYNSSANDAQSNSSVLSNCDECEGTGFRTVIDGSTFLTAFKVAFPNDN